MTEKVIPLADHRYAARVPRIPQRLDAPTGLLRDTLGRPLHDLRISVTDRCNFRCSYCMPKEVFDKDYRFLPHSSLLSFEEITRTARLFVAHGVRKIRLTGGEPLLRKNLEVLVSMLGELRTPDGAPLDLTLTTNGSLLTRKAQALKDAGLRRVTVSLDALDDAVFRRMNDADFPVAEVLAGIDAARAAGLGPIKVNMVVKHGTNDDQILPMARHFKGSGAALPLEALEASEPGETAQRWAYADGSGEIGVISSVTQAFCHDCNRARLSTEGKLFLCLFANHGHDLRALLRSGYDDAQIAAAIGLIWQGRDDRYSELRGSAPASGDATAEPRVEMHYIGG
jgi:cyclic pyranopterin phosphate synthase